MATVSFDKDFSIKKTEDVNKFINIVCANKPLPEINKSLASDENMNRGRELLKHCLSR